MNWEKKRGGIKAGEVCVGGGGGGGGREGRGGDDQ